ncbi:hypothetical protein GCM10010214_02210 [Streptomyces abikoensis]|nr:hypothetical protein GCM10010214_02210 [Streptomyces abikoensis]
MRRVDAATRPGRLPARSRPEATAPRTPGGVAAARARRLHAAVHELLDQGMALRAIARHLDPPPPGHNAPASRPPTRDLCTKSAAYRNRALVLVFNEWPAIWL